MPGKIRSDVIPKIFLPRGLAEFEGTLPVLEYTRELVGRLPKKHTKTLRFLFERAMEAQKLAEEAAHAARQQARFAALAIWGTCLEKYTIAQLQRATGYDMDE